MVSGGWRACPLLSALALTLLLGAHAAAQTTPSATLTVPATAKFAEGTGNTTVIVTATLSEARSAATVIDLTLGGSAKSTDYVVVQLPDITIGAGQMEGTAHLTLRPVDDVFFEGLETVRIGGAATGITVHGVDVDLEDNDKAPSLETSIDPSFRVYYEGDSITMRITVRLVNGTFEEEETVELSLVRSTLESGDVDYGETPPPWQLSIPAGATSAMMDLTFTAVDDDDPEQIEGVDLQASVTVGGTTIKKIKGFFSISTSDSPIEVTVHCRTEIRHAFAGDTLTCTPYIRNGPTSREYTVTANFATGMVTPNPMVLTIPSGSSGSVPTASEDIVLSDSAQGTLSPRVAIAPNDMGETVRVSSITISPAADPKFKISGIDLPFISRKVRIVGDDAFGFVFPTPTPIDGFGGHMRMAVELDSGIVWAACINGGFRFSPFCVYHVGPGDYDFDGQIAIPAGAVKFTNWRSRGDPTVTGTVDSPLPAAREIHRIPGTFIYGGSHAIDLSVTPQSLQEGTGETALTITATNRLNASNNDIVIPLTLTDISTSSADYTVSGPLSLTIPAGRLEGSTTAVRLTPVDDLRREATVETLRIGGPTGSKTTPFVRSADLNIVDAAGIALSVSPTAIAEEGGSQQVTVSAAWDGAGTSVVPTDTVVALAWGGTAGAGDYARSGGASVTIPADARSGSTTVTITPTNDNLLEGDESIEIRGSASGRTVVATEMTLEDDETVPAVSLAVDTDSMAESGSAQTVTVSATLDPEVAMANDVTTVTLSLGGTAVQGTDYTRTWSPATPTISIPVNATEGSNTVSLTLKPIDDQQAEGYETIVVQGTATTSARSLVVQVATVTLEDDDERGVQLLPKAVTVAEGEDTTYEVWLGSQPTNDVTVTLASTDATIAKTNPEELTFSTSAWRTRQTVTVSGVEDLRANSGGERSAEIRHTPSGGGYDEVGGSVLAVTVEDNDVPGLVVAPTAVAVGEGGSESYTVKLTTEPSAAVTVAITGHADTDVSLDETSLEFTTAKWNEAQTVTVTAAEDDDGINDVVTLAHAASGGGYGSVAKNIVVTVTDDDPALVVAPTAVAVGEGGSAKYTVALATEPSATVTVAISGHAATDVTLSAASLEFTTADWNEAQTVTVSAGQDDDGANDVVTLAHAASGGNYGSVSKDVVVTVTDDDDRALVVTPSAVAVGEGGSEKYTVALATEPSATVTVAISGHAATDVSLDATSLEFTTATWNEAQTVTVSAAQDDDGTDDEVTLAHAASGGNYGSVSKDVVVTVTDDDDRALVVTPSAVTVGEGGSAKYTVALATEPSATVTVAISGHADTDVTLSAASLEFTATTWNEAQTVTVSAGQDDDGSNDEVTLAHAASGGNYGSVSKDVVVTVTDDDDRALVVTPSAVTVGEGGSEKYTVALATEPSATVTVAISGHADTDVSLDATSLEFTATTWNEAQTVTVSAAQDDDGADDEVTLAHAASGGDYGSVSKDVVVTVTDDDRALVVTPSAVTVGEGGSEKYTVALATEPSATVTVAISGHAATDVTLSAASLEFTTATWNEAQTVTVSAGQDDDGSNDVVTLAHAASGGNYGSVSKDVVVTVTDDDDRALVVTPSAVTVGEGGSEKYTVALATEPSATVTVAITGHATTDVTLSAASLEFTAATWNEAQTVTVSAGQDDDGADDEVTLAHAASGGDYGSVSKDVVVTVTDDDRALVVTPSAVTVGEGGSEKYTVALATEPSETVTVAITGTNGTDLTLDKTSLTFTTAKWNEAQTVTVSAGQDDDGANESVTLAHAASGGNYGSVSKDVVVTVTDDDTAGLVVTPSAVTVGEGGSEKYTVALATEPSATVTVAISGHADTDVGLDATSLEFTAATWNEAQTVTVSAGQDDDGADDEVTLAHAASGGDYGSVSKDVVVTVTDDDRALVVTPSAVTVGEGGSEKYTVVLATEPSATVTVAISGHATTDVTLSAASLEFTTADWNEAQTVTVSAGQDDDGSNDEVTLAHAASGGNYGSVSKDVVVTVTDDDDRALVVTPSAVTVGEGGSAKYTVALATEPSATVTVAITGHADTDVSLDATSLEFTATTWNEAQTVTVSAAQDDDGADDEVTLAHAASGGDYGSVSKDVVVTVTDDDRALVVTPSAVTVGEGGSEKYTVALATEPSETVTVAITGTNGTDLTLDKTSLTFTTAKWNEAQTVTVSAGQDDDGANESVTLAHAASGGNYGSVSKDVVVTVTDDDTAGLVVTPSAVTVGEGGSEKYTVALATEPSATVTVAISGHADTDVGLDATSLEFTAATWNEAQTVTVSAGQDDDGADDEVTLAHAASGGDYGSVSKDVVVTVTDDDRALVVTPSAVTVGEGGSEKYTVVLATEPSATVTVAITGHASTDVTLSAASLEFTTATWNEAQTVTVSAGQDDDGSNDEVTLAHAASGGNYGSVSKDVVVTVTDDDDRALVVTPSAVTVGEGGSEKYTVALATEPSATVTVAITGHADTDVGLDAASLEFTTSTWNEAQTVTVSAAQDDDGADDEVTLAHAASGGDYGSVSKDVVVTVTDDDRALVVTPSAVTVGEGGSEKYTVALATEPSATVTVAISGHADTDVTLSAASLEFTTADWNEAQTVTVSAGQDDDGSNDEVTLAHAASGGNYGSVSKDVVVTVTDDDDRALVVTPSAVTVGEGGSEKYTVALATEPSATVTVAISGHADTDVSLDATSLEFTATTWNEAQTVTVSAAQDDDGADDEVTLAHAASGGDYGSVSKDVVVTVTDDDRALVVTPSAVTVGEGGSEKYTVALATEPSATVTVAISGHAATDVTLSAASLEFTTATWNEAQTVTVSAGQDDDGSNDEVTLAHAASGGNYGSVSKDVVVTVTDDDDRALVVTPSAVTVGEGGSEKYTVALATEPSATVTVAITGHADTDVGLDAASLEFTTATWNEAQTVTVSAAQDDDGADDEVTLAHAASGGDYGSVSKDVVVTVTDDDRALVVTPSAVTVGEGGSEKYTVALATEPSATVTVAISGHADTDVGLDATSLEFTAATWNEAQTVTVSAGQDDDGADDEVTLAHAASGGDYGSVSKDVVVTVTDDDRALVVTPSAVTVGEGGSEKYTVVLATEPSATVTVAITGHASTDVTLSAASLEFTTATWNEAQTVTVSAGQDDDGSNDEVTLAHAASGGNYGSVSKDVVVTVTDDDDRALVVTPSAVTVGEGGSEKYTVALATEPSATVTVAITGHADTDVGLDAASLEFTTSTWNEAQTVTVSAAQDDDGADDEVTLAHAASGGDYGSVSKDVVVTVTDDDRALVVTPSAVTVGEGGSEKYTVALATEPSATVTVAISGHADTDVTLSAASLEFTTADWNEAQTVTVSAGQDDDGSNDEVTLAHAASGGNYGSVSKDVVVTVTDDDDRALVVTPSAVTVGEGGSEKYTVALATEPSATVTVAISGHADTDVSLDATSLEFTATTWNEAQTVTVSAAQDDDGADDEVTLAHAASGGDYGSVSKDVVVTVTDDDRALVVTPSAVTVGEGGSEKYTVALATEPSATVTVAISGHAATDVTLSAASLEFTTATWNEAQTVTVSAGQDDDGSNDVVTLAHAASGGNYGSVSKDVVVTVTDDDDRALVVTPSAVTVGEGGSEKYTVALATEPSATVTVAITGHADTDVGLDAASLEFTTATWNEAQTVTVSAAQDDDGADDEVTLAHAASGGDYGSVSKDVVVTVTDDDRALVVTPSAVTVGEGGSEKYTVALATEPSATVTVAISGHADTDVGLDATSLEFTAATWNEAQTVTVSAGQDDDGADDEVTLAHAASGGDYGSVSKDVVVTVTDDDRALVVTPSAVTVGEGGSEKYTVVLATEPSATVTVAISGHATTDVTLSAASLEFTTADWNEAQTVTVSAGQDDDGSNDEVTLAHAASGGNYGSVSKDVVVTVTDDDDRALVVTPSAVTVGEGGSEKYTVALATEPSATVTVAITGHATTDVTLSAASLEFTAATWNEAQTVTVSAAQDDDGADDEVTLAHAASGGDYGSVSKDVVVTVTDDDRALVVTPSAVTVGEGGSEKYTVALATEPSETVTVAITGTNGTDLTLDKTSLTFTTAKWNEAQTVTVSAGQDDDGANESVTLAHAASGGNYGSVSKDVVVTVTDDDTAGLVVTPSAVTVGEGGSEKYTVALATEPSATVTVAISGHADTDVGLDATSLEFTAATWNEAQTVTVSAGQDDDGADDEVTLAHAASGGDYGSVSKDVVVTVTDDDRALVVTPSAVTVGEGGSEKYTVVLATEPSATVTVAISGHATTDVTLSAASLEFTTADWNEAQTVTVSAGQDDDGSNDEVTLAHAASGGNYGSVSKDVVVTVTDDDDRALVVTPSAVTVGEGGSAKYTVALATEPSATVTVAITGHADTDVGLDAASLEFTTSTWNEAQTVTVSAGQDDDGTDDEVTLAHAASGGDYGSVSKDVVVTVTDDDRALVVTPSAVTVGEGGSAKYTVALATEPSETVTVAISGHAATDVTLSATSLEFTTATWNEAQTVTVSAGQDDDGSNDEVTLAHAASGGNYGSVSKDVVVTVTDDDAAGLVVTPSAVTVGEGGSEKYTVALATEPSATVTVAITGHAATDVGLDAASLEFTATTWNEAQTVTVSAAQDDDGTDEEVTLAHAASGGDYGSVSKDVVVTVSDDDRALVVTPSAVTVGEGGSEKYTVALATEPSATVTVTISGHAATDVTLSATSLEFTTATWNEAQTVTVSAGQDDDGSNDEVTLAHAASGGNYGSVSKDVVVTVTDDDAAGLVVTPSAVTVGEGGSEKYTVALATEPSATVTVAITGHAATDVGLDAASLEFTATTWNEAQTVTVSAGQDDDGTDDEVTLAHAASGGNYGSVSKDVVVTVTDDDDRALVVTPSAVTVGEGGSAKYTVALATEPSATVTVAITGHAATDVGLDAASLEFTATTWNEAQTVTVSAGQDDDGTDDEVTLAHAASGGNYGSVSKDVVVTVTDDDAAGLVVTPSAVTVSEGGSAKYTVALATEPSATVTVAITGHAATDVGLDAASLEFTTSTWNEAQTVTVSAAQDDDGADDEVTLAHAASGGNYGSVSKDVVVTVTDDDAVGLVVTPAAVTVAEGGSAKYTVALATEPSATVTVAITGHAATDVGLDATSLEFLASKWNEAQTVTVSAGQDDDGADDSVTLAHAASGGNYAGVSKSVAVTVIDDDELSTAVTLTLDPTEVSEGAEPTAVTVTAALNAATLAQDVVVQVTVAPDTAGAEDFLAVTPFALTIGEGEHSGTATFTFAPVDDVFDEPDETVTVSGRITEPPDSTLTVAPAALTIVDDDETPTISIADASAVESAGEIVFPVTLNGVSSQTITVSYRTTDGTAEAGADYMAGDGELSFAPGETERSVTIAVIDDALDEADETFLVQLGEAENATVADGEATGTITDEDQTPLITIADASVVESSGDIGFLVTLDGPSGRPISVVCRSADGTAIADDDYIEEIGVLRFEPGETQKTISMEVLDDAVDEDTEQFLLNLSEPTNVRLAAEVVSAVGTIKDDDAAVTVAWLARFGRTVTQQVLEAVGERTHGGPALGSQVSLAGHRVSADALVVGGDEEQAESDVLSGRSGDYRIMSGGEFLAASSFLVATDPGTVDQAGGVTEEAGAGVRWTVWGRGATTSFEGLDEDGRLSIDGNVLTGLAGVDADLGGWLGGLAVGRSDGNGGYGWAESVDRPAREGDLEAELTSVYPYVRVPVTDWLSVWGVFGYGVGELRQVEEERLEEQTAIGMLLGAFGGRGELLTANSLYGGGLELAVTADGYLLRMTSESAPVLPTVEADVRRLRLTAEGSGQVRIGSGLVVRPSVEIGVRHDGGDVENGTGVELGGGLSLTDLGIGLALSGNARVLVTHEDRGYRAWGAAGSLSFDPGAPGRGLAVRVDSSYGAAAGGVEQLWSQGSADLGGAAVPVGRVGAEVGYGVAATDWSVRPYAGVELAGDSPEWRAGTRFGLGAHNVVVAGTDTEAPAPLPYRTPASLSRIPCAGRAGARTLRQLPAVTTDLTDLRLRRQNDRIDRQQLREPDLMRQVAGNANDARY